MVTEKEIEAERIKAGYSGKITPYIRKQLIKRVDAAKDKIEIGTKDSTESIKKIKKSSKKAPKKKIKNVLKRIGRGVKVTGDYLSECSVRFAEEEKIKTQKKTTRKIPKKSTRKPKKRVSTEKTMKDIDRELMKFM